MFNKRVKIKELLAQEPVHQEVTVMGWVRTFRNNQFIALNDGSTNTNLQVVVELGKYGVEFLREIAHLRFRTNTFGSVFRVRHSLGFAVHKFFNDKGFIYLHTPIITASDAEGAGEMFRVTTLPFDQTPRNELGEVNFAADFFGRAANLTVSGQ